MATAEKSSAVGDAAKLREALKLCGSQMCKFCKEFELAKSMLKREMLGVYCHPDKCEALRALRAALAAPARNCDKYENDNAIEQFEREILGKEAATTYDRLENMRENWFRYNRWLFEKAAKESEVGK